MSDSDLSSLRKLVHKVGSEIPEIRLRSINNIFNKLQNGLLQPRLLISFQQFPGLLMTWINDNKQRSDALYKVIFILGKFTETQQGLILLRQYECLQFCEDFRKYLFVNQRNVDSFLKKLDEIINRLLPLGRAEQGEIKRQEQIMDEQGVKTKQKKKQEYRQKGESQIIVIKTYVNSLNEHLQKSIFDLMVALKYANKQALHPTLCQIRQFLSRFHQHYFRCKADLFGELLQAGIQNIYPQICIQCAELILIGLRKSSCYLALGQVVNLTEGKIVSQPTAQTSVQILKRIWSVPQSFVLIEQLIKYKQMGLCSSSLLLGISYSSNPWYYARILALLTQQQIKQSDQIVVHNVRKYCHTFPQTKKHFIKFLPQSVCNQISLLVGFNHKNSQAKAFKKLQPYLIDSSFCFSSNLHIIRQILQDLQQGIQGMTTNPKKAATLYTELLLTLAISVARQDPMMSYYPNAKQLILKIGAHPDEKVSIACYESLLDCLQKSISITYGGTKQDCQSIMQMIMSDRNFAMKLFQISMDSQKTLETMLRIMLSLMSKNKNQSFLKLNSLIFALTYHNSESISSLSTNILTNIPKKHQISTLALKLFSNDLSVRLKLISQFQLNQTEPTDIASKALAKSNCKNTKKQLKISKQSIGNSFNIIFNPDIDEEVKCSAADELIGFIERMRMEDGEEDCTEFCEFMIVKIRQLGDIQDISKLSQRIITLFWTMSKKLGLSTNVFSIDFLIGLFCRIKMESTQITLFYLMYEKVFQSPFNEDQLVTSWVMNYYPHIKIITMPIQHPLITRSPQPAENDDEDVETVNKNESWMGNLIYGLVLGIEFNKSQIHKLEQQLAGAVADCNSVQLSKISLIISRANPKYVNEMQGNSVNLIEHVLAKKQVSNWMEYDILRILQSLNKKGRKSSINSVDRFQTISIPHLLQSLNQCTSIISCPIIERVIKACDESSGYLNQIYTCFVKRKIEWDKLDEYSCLRLIENIVKVLRHQTYDTELRVLALGLLMNLIQGGFPVKDHKTSIMGILRLIILDQKITVKQFCMAMDCVSLLSYGTIATQASFFKSLTTKVFNLLSSVLNKAKDHTLIISSCFMYIGCLLRISLTEDLINQHTPIIKQIRSKDVASLATHFISSLISQQGIKFNTQNLIFMEAGCQLLYLWGQSEQNSPSFLLNSTPILMTLLQLIQKIQQTQQSSISAMKVLNSLGRLLHLLSRNFDQFIFKLNSVIKSQNLVLRYVTVHKTLCSPLRQMMMFAQKNNHKNYDTGYLQAIVWVMLIWEPSRPNLQDEGLLHELIECCAQWNCFTSLSNIAMISKNAQKLISEHPSFGQLCRNWTKNIDEIIVEITKQQKSIRKEKRNTQGINIGFILKIIKFFCSLFTPNNNQSGIMELSTNGKDQITVCIKAIDKIGAVIGLINNGQVNEKWNKLMHNLFMCDLAAKSLNFLIMEGYFSVVSQVISRVVKLNHNNCEDKESLMILGKMSCNETVRSLIFKHKIIEQLNSNLIQMDENKVGKLNYGFIYSVASFFHHLSIFKDYNAKILNDKRALGFWVKIVSMQQVETVEKKVVELLANLASYKHNKTTFMGSQDVHKVCLGLLSDPSYQLKQQILALLYNILYKNAAGAKLYRRKEVIRLLEDMAQCEDNQQLPQALIQILSNDDL